MLPVHLQDQLQDGTFERTIYHLLDNQIEPSGFDSRYKNDEVRAPAYDSAVPVIDRMANRGIIKKNKAARHKSRLNARVKALAS